MSDLKNWRCAYHDRGILWVSDPAPFCTECGRSMEEVPKIVQQITNLPQPPKEGLSHE